MSVTLKDNTGKTLRAVAFRVIGTPIETHLQNKDQLLNVAGSVKHSLWNGQEQVSFIIDDLLQVK